VLEQAKKADEMFAKKEVTLLTGIPMAIKNNICIKGKRTTAGSKILENYKAVYDATVIKKLKAEGVVFIGGTNLDEFGMGSSTENSAYGVTKNPFDETRVPGGSSGGSAVAVATGACLAALGTDTGGSVRQPASFCGVVGMKSTYGAVSRHGAIAMGSSLDQISPLGKAVDDVQIIFDCIKGDDEMDSTTIPDKVYQEAHIEKKNKVIGVPKHFVEKGVDEDVLANFYGSVDRLKNNGYEIKEIDLPNLEYALAVYYIIMPAEVSTNLSRYDGVRYGLLKEGENLLEDYLKTKGEGFGKEARRRIMLGTYILSAGYSDAYYNKAVALRDIIRKDFEEVFKTVDAIITPTSPTPAFKIGEKLNDPLQMYLSDIFTVSVNVVGIPAISIPSGFVKRDEKDLPLGLQIMVSEMREDIMFEISENFLGKIA
jgi:aspartyl-tRNA(Asn)/glutamyl-tRNA(Gln) amidotransferase subunit A